VRKPRTSLAVAAMAAMALLTAVGASAQHNTTGEDHLLISNMISPPTDLDPDGEGDWGKIELVGKLIVPDAENDLIADLTVDPDGDYAYLARWGGSQCAGPEGAPGGHVVDGGVYVIDIAEPGGSLESPQLVGFIPTHQDTLVGEGMQVVEITTSNFSGDVLVLNHEQCGKNGKGGVSLWDVTDPLKPKKLSENFGDFTIDGDRTSPHDANETHSAFAWDAGDRAYLVSVDDLEAQDVDIYDITDPKHPVLIGEFNLNEGFDDDPPLDQPELGLTDTFFHDVVVKEINGDFIMLLSYWDAGWVLLNVNDPANPVFIGDSDYPNVDPELLEQAGIALTPEGNAHQAEFTSDNQYVIGTDEDFGPYRAVVTTDDSGAQEFRAGVGSPAPQIPEATPVTGETVFVGRACPGDPAVPAGDGTQIAVVERGLCTFSEKLAVVEEAGGYVAVIIMNREGADACADVFGPFVEADIPVIFVGRDTGFGLFDNVPGLVYDEAACLDPTQNLAPIPIGTVGDVVTITSRFDGWGYVHLFDVNLDPAAGENAFTELDTYAIPEAMDRAYAEGYGALSVHEVATDPQDPSLAYLSYYSGGLRAIQIQNGELVEVGGFIDNDASDGRVGNEFWGVETLVRDGVTYVLASDMDSGLWIFRDP
jgi:hypothetical protein